MSLQGESLAIFFMKTNLVPLQNEGVSSKTKEDWVPILSIIIEEDGIISTIQMLIETQQSKSLSYLHVILMENFNFSLVPSQLVRIAENGLFCSHKALVKT